MAVRSELLPLSYPGLRATRWWSDELHTGMKETYAIVRVEAGHSEWAGGGKLWTSEPGSLMIQQPGDVHRDVSRDGPGMLQIVSFQPSVVESITGKIRVHQQLAAGDPRGAPFQRLHDAVQAGADAFTFEIAVAEALSAFGAVGDGKLDHTRPVRRALELLRERLAEPVTLDDLAEHARLDKFHLCRAFRAQVGMPPHAYLTRLRIMRSKELLSAGIKPSEVAPRVGLYDQSQLNRHFRRIVGTTPARFAREA